VISAWHLGPGDDAHWLNMCALFDQYLTYRWQHALALDGRQWHHSS
jgi:hypothetical protein